MPLAARLTDAHACPMTDPKPHVGGVIAAPGVPNVLIGGKPAAVAGDLCACLGPPNKILKGSTKVEIGGRAAARKEDPTSHGGVILTGFPQVEIG